MELTDCEELFFGGAAGPGKSDFLLMAALQYVHVPGYAALILRTDYQRLNLEGGLIPRSHQWLANTPAKWNGTAKRWRFPSGATISFGYLDNPNARYRYGSSEYQYIGFDELTEFDEQSYSFMFSRLRSTVNIPVPFRVRSASNPGGAGHHWVKNRFVTKDAIDFLRGLDSSNPTPDGSVFFNGHRAFIPGRLADNPFIRREEYVKQLIKLDPVTRERLLTGDWTVTEGGRVRAEWLRSYQWAGDQYRLLKPDSEVLAVIMPHECNRYAIVDCAASSEDVAREKRGKPPSHSVITTVDFCRPLGLMMVREVRRGRWEFPELCEQVASVCREQHPGWVGVEDEKTGRALLQLMRHLPVRAISHGNKGKLERFSKCANMLADGRVYFPQICGWRDTMEAELLSWTGHEDEPFDIGDTLAYAAIYADWNLAGPAAAEGVVMSFKRRF